MCEHEFQERLERERSQQEVADNFYTEKLGATLIKRYSSDSQEDMEFQRKDIDVTLTIDGEIYHVSEKFRDKDWGDLLLEIYSKYPGTPGWINTGSADIMAYFFPERMFWIDDYALSSFCIDQVFQAIPRESITEIMAIEKSCRRPLTITINDTDYETWITKAFNRTRSGATWNTISITVPLNLLRNNGIEFSEYAYSAIAKKMHLLLPVRAPLEFWALFFD
jgi:hypothetical protein